MAEVGLEVLILPVLGLQAGTTMLSLCGTRDQTQGLVHVTKALCQQSYILSLLFAVVLRFIHLLRQDFYMFNI